MSKKLNISKDFLIEEYTNKNKSVNKLAKEIGYGKTTLLRYLRNYNIYIRTQGETKRYSQIGEGNPFYGKKHSKKTRNIISSTMLERGTTKGKNNPSFKYTISKEFLIKEYIKNNKTTGQIAKELGCHVCTILRNLKAYNIYLKPQNIEKKESFKGPKNPNWKGGLSFLPYPAEFNQDLKYRIRKRDDYTCQNCNIVEEEYLIVYGRNLDVHHIDYNKENCRKDNLITLCTSCNVRANYNRSYWKDFFKNKLRVI